MLRRSLLALATLCCSLSALTPVKADLIYDSFNGLNQVTNSFTTTASTPRNFMGDEMSTLQLANPLVDDWRVDDLGVRIFVSGSGVAGQNVVYNNVTMRVRVYNDWDNTAPAGSSVFTDLVSDVTWNLGTITNNSPTGGALFFQYGLPYLANNLQFLLDDGQDMGITVDLRVAGVADQRLALLLRSLAGDPGFPAVGTSPNGWYRDANSNGILEASDRRVFAAPNNSNAHFQIFATVIPEPGTFGLLTVAIGGLLLRRRRPVA